MRVFDSITDFMNKRQSLDGPLGFVPTMGALHDGHESLVKRSLRENKNTVVNPQYPYSIFKPLKPGKVAYTNPPIAVNQSAILINFLGEYLSAIGPPKIYDIRATTPYIEKHKPNSTLVI